MNQHVSTMGTERVSSLRAMGLCLLGAGLTAYVGTAENAYLYTMVAVLFFCVAAPIGFDWHRGRLDLFATIHVIGGISFAYFGLGAVWTIQDPQAVAYDRYVLPYIPRALLYCLLGYLALLAAYYMPWSGRPVRPRPNYVPRGTVLVAACGTIGLAGYLLQAIGQFTGKDISSFSQLYPLFLFAWALSWIQFFSGQTSRAGRFWLFGILVPGVLVVVAMTFSNKSMFLTMVGVPIIARWYARRKIPVIPLVSLLLILVLVIFPFYNTFRIFDRTLGQSGRLLETYNLIKESGSDWYMDRSVRSFKGRLALINSVAVVLRDTGRRVPYAAGETLLMTTVVFFIPRTLWPSKPQFTQGQDFGWKFRLVNVTDRNTHIAPSVPGELYWNFDLPGILIGMALWGLAIRMLYRRYGEGPDVGIVRRAIHIVILVQFAYLAEGHVAAHIVGIIRGLIMLEFVCWVARRNGWLVPAQPAPTSAP